MKCGFCDRETEHLGIKIKTVWCEHGSSKMCKDCCIKQTGKNCHWWTMCWDKVI